MRSCIFLLGLSLKRLSRSRHPGTIIRTVFFAYHNDSLPSVSQNFTRVAVKSIWWYVCIKLTDLIRCYYSPSELINLRDFLSTAKKILFNTGSGKIQHFAYSIKIEILLFSIYNVWITSLLSRSIYNSTISELRTKLCNVTIIASGKLACADILRISFADLVTINTGIIITKSEV